MSSKQLGEMFEGDSADKCGKKFPFMSLGAERRVSLVHTWEEKFWQDFCQILIVFIEDAIFKCA